MPSHRMTAAAATVAVLCGTGAAADPLTLMSFDTPDPCVPLEQAPHICSWSPGPDHNVAVMSAGLLLADNVGAEAAADETLRTAEAWRWATYVTGDRVGGYPLEAVSIRHAEPSVSDLPTTCYRYDFALTTPDELHVGRGEGLSCVVIDPERGMVFGLNLELSERRPLDTEGVPDFDAMAEAVLASLRYNP